MGGADDQDNSFAPIIMKEEDINIKLPSVKKMPSPRAVKPEKKKKELQKFKKENEPLCSVGF